MKRHAESPPQTKKKAKLEPRPNLATFLHDTFPLIISFLDRETDLCTLGRCMRVSQTFHTLVGPRLYREISISKDITLDQLEVLSERRLIGLNPSRSTRFAHFQTTSPLCHLRFLSISAHGIPYSGEDLFRMAAKRRFFNSSWSMPVLSKLAVVDLPGNRTRHYTWLTGVTSAYVPFNIHELVLSGSPMVLPPDVIRAPYWRPRLPPRILHRLQTLVLVDSWPHMPRSRLFDDNDRILETLDKQLLIKLVLYPLEYSSYSITKFNAETRQVISQLKATIHMLRQDFEAAEISPSVIIEGLAETLDPVCMNVGQAFISSFRPDQMVRHDYQASQGELERAAKESMTVGAKKKKRIVEKTLEIKFKTYAEYFAEDGWEGEVGQNGRTMMRMAADTWDEYIKKRGWAIEESQSGQQ